MNPVVANAIEQLKNAERLDFWEAAKLLVREKDRSVVPELIALLTSGADTERRVAAAWTLGFMSAADALGPLIEIVEGKSQPPQLRDHAAEALGYLRHPAAHNTVVRNLTDEHADVVFSCAFALRTLGIPDDIPHLARLAGSPMVNAYGASVAEQAKGAIEDIEARFSAGETDKE